MTLQLHTCPTTMIQCIADCYASILLRLCKRDLFEFRNVTITAGFCLLLIIYVYDQTQLLRIIVVHLSQLQKSAFMRFALELRILEFVLRVI